MKKDKTTRIADFTIDPISRQGMLQDALDLALEAIKNGSFETDLYFFAADMAYRTGDIHKAEQLIDRLLALDPDHVEGWTLFGDIHNRINNIAGNLDAHHITETLVPDLTAEEIKTFNFFKNMDNKSKDGKIEEPKESLNFDTITYADICARQGYYNKALKIYQDHLKKNPHDEGLKKKIADIEKRLKDD
ncbi:MAG: tetratricopeptide repeat protein [Candidatus Zixiibacteriota bacterium]|nr:MAG: tetratricopeptide repeat protein [candidate division Zixibacteria bacterium]